MGVNECNEPDESINLGSLVFLIRFTFLGTANEVKINRKVAVAVPMKVIVTYVYI